MSSQRSQSFTPPLCRVSTVMASAAAFALAAACAATPPAGTAPPAGICNASGAQFMIGRPLTADLEKEALVRSGAGVVRVIRPGQMVTMEYNERRLSIEVDAAGRVIRARCG